MIRPEKTPRWRQFETLQLEVSDFNYNNPSLSPGAKGARGRSFAPTARLNSAPSTLIVSIRNDESSRAKYTRTSLIRFAQVGIVGTNSTPVLICFCHCCQWENSPSMPRELIISSRPSSRAQATQREREKWGRKVGPSP